MIKGRRLGESREKAREKFFGESRKNKNEEKELNKPNMLFSFAFVYDNFEVQSSRFCCGPYARLGNLRLFIVSSDGRNKIAKRSTSESTINPVCGRTSTSNPNLFEDSKYNTTIHTPFTCISDGLES